jgi:hypothetical protein
LGDGIRSESESLRSSPGVAQSDVCPGQFIVSLKQDEIICIQYAEYSSRESRKRRSRTLWMTMQAFFDPSLSFLDTFLRSRINVDWPRFDELGGFAVYKNISSNFTIIVE